MKRLKQINFRRDGDVITPDFAGGDQPFEPRSDELKLCTRYFDTSPAIIRNAFLNCNTCVLQWQPNDPDLERQYKLDAWAKPRSGE